MNPRYSLVIPAYNEERLLGRLLDSVRVAKQSYGQPEAVEDVMIMAAMRRLGKSRGQRLARVTKAKAVASTRKFDEFGDWHYFPLALEGVRHLWGGKPTEFTDRYWYKPKR